MLPNSIQKFIDDFAEKPLAHYEKKNPDFLYDFVRQISWDDKFDIIETFIESKKIEAAANLIDAEIVEFLKYEFKKKCVGTSPEKYLEYKLIVKEYEQAIKDGIVPDPTKKG